MSRGGFFVSKNDEYEVADLKLKSRIEPLTDFNLKLVLIRNKENRVSAFLTCCRKSRSYGPLVNLQ